jgi:hypothetical protein
MDEVNLGVTPQEKNRAEDSGNGHSYSDPYPTNVGGSMGAMGEGPVCFPHFHYRGPVDLELPDDGEMTIRFCKKTETSSIDNDGKHWYCCKIEVRAIKDVDGKGPPEAHIPAPSKSFDEASGALDKIREGLEKDSEGDEDDASEGY